MKSVALVALAVLATCAVLALGVLLAWSPGKARPMLDATGAPIPGSISEKVRVRINGVEQGMFITGNDRTKPVLLFIHGGPGMPEYFLTEKYPTGLEDDFVVCWWDQRGAGLSYSPDIPADSMTVAQTLADTEAVTNYLRQRFGQDKIYLMGHSWGSLIGIKAAARTPQLYHAYIGMGQISKQAVSEKLAYDYELDQFKKRGDTAMVRKLEAAPVTIGEPLPASYVRVRDTAMHSLGVGTTRDMDSVVTGIFLPSLRSPEYTLGEKVNLWRGKIFSRRLLWDDMMRTDLTAEVPELQIPVYLLHGRHDYTVSYSEARSYFQQLKAPRKGFYTFEESAHTPLFEEPAKVDRVLREDVLAGRCDLADAPAAQ